MPKSLRPILLLVCALMLSADAVSAAPPPKPVIRTPGDNEIYTTHTPFLEWDEAAGATSYRIIIKKGAGAGKVVYTTTLENPGLICLDTICGHSLASDDVSLLNGPHQWRVIAINADGRNASPFEPFIIDFPGKATLVAPLSNQIVGLTPVFQWTAVDAAEQYSVVVVPVGGGPRLQSILLASAATCSGANCTFQFNSLIRPGDYRWWVEASQITFPNISRSAKRIIRVRAN